MQNWSRLVCVTAVTALLSSAWSAPAQTGKPDNADATFEAASVKLAPPDTPYYSDNDLSGTAAWVGTGLRATTIFNSYLSFAYNVTDSVQGMVFWKSLPDWAKKDKYEIQATAFPGVTREQVRVMMRNLLAERFALRIHKEVRQENAFALSQQHAGSLGPQFRVHEASRTCVSDPNRPNEIAAPAPGTKAPPYCGVTVWVTGGQRHVQIVNATMSEIATALTDESIYGGFPTPHAGTDVSGLKDRYDLDLQYVDADKADASGGPTFQEALKKQAGLKLVERREPMQIIVLDHLERPTPN